MSLSIEQQQRVIQHLEREQAGTLCQICKKGELKVHPEMVCTPLAESTRGEIKIYARDVISLVQVVCPECWHVEHFIADGILNFNN